MSKETAERVVTLDREVDDEIAECLNLENPTSFFLFAGAGSGKTGSLITGLKHLQKYWGPSLRLRGQQIAVVTYTNAAVDEIIGRIKADPLFQVSTIHSFAWRLIEGLNTDIRHWLKSNLENEIQELQLLESKGRPGTKASILRVAQIESKRERLTMLSGIKSFIYNPNGDNRERNSLSHSEVISISSDFLLGKPTMQKILVRQFPFFLVDESQDTNRKLVDSLMRVESENRSHFCLGFFGDMMQRIYNEGKEKFGESLPKEWRKPVKKLNFRCPKRVVQLINRIRADADGQEQQAVSPIEGIVRLFLFSADNPDKPASEEAARMQMAEITGDPDWKERERCKMLILEHHMAARRMGFQGVFEPLSKVDEFRTGLLDGTLPALRFFVKDVLPVVHASQKGDKFAVARVLRNLSPILSEASLTQAHVQIGQLQKARMAVDLLMSEWKNGQPTCAKILLNIAKTSLLPIPESLRPFVALGSSTAKPNDEKVNIAERLQALEAFLEAPFTEIAQYADYLSETAPFDTHQGVKGREFDRVMVVIDDSEARGFMFKYDKLFGAEPNSATDEKNVREGKESSVDRTRRLFYVTCSRAKQSLAIVAYTSNPTQVRQRLVTNGWLMKNEILPAI